MKDRPSRFGLILEMPPLSMDARIAYGRRKYPMLHEDTLADLAMIIQDKPLDYLEECCKLSLMGYETDEIRDRMNDIRRPQLELIEDTEDDE